ncbi:hypothetical protein HDU76_009861, partial [Blyttiomyces sp. JEL0837]
MAPSITTTASSTTTTTTTVGSSSSSSLSNKKQYISTTTSTTTTPTTPTQQRVGGRIMKTFTREDLIARTEQGDILVIFNNKVYDLTKWAPYHPGGELALVHMK